MTVFFLCFVLFLVGLYCIVTKKNILKIVVGLAIVEYAINLFLILLGYKQAGYAPILLKGVKDFPMVDPLPQAMVLTSIVISLATLALAVGICVRLYEKYRTFDITEIRRLRG